MRQLSETCKYRTSCMLDQRQTKNEKRKQNEAGEDQYSEMNVKTRKLTQPKIAVALVGDMPSFMPPGKIPFITHMCKQAQKVPTMAPTSSPRGGVALPGTGAKARAHCPRTTPRFCALSGGRIQADAAPPAATPWPPPWLTLSNAIRLCGSNATRCTCG